MLTEPCALDGDNWTAAARGESPTADRCWNRAHVGGEASADASNGWRVMRRDGACEGLPG